jgi:hypothetical protein
VEVRQAAEGTGLTDPDDDKTKDQEDKEERARRWLRMIETYDKEYRPWHRRCEKIIRIFTEKRRVDGVEVRRMSLLWSNISVLQPAIYARMPQPSVTRRFRDDDPVARTASEMVERAIHFTFDDTDFDGVMRGVRDDYLLVGRGTGWVRYDADFSPLMGTDDKPLNKNGAPLNDGEEAGEQLEGEHVCWDYVNWRDFGHNVARTWQEVTTVWRKVYMDREDGNERFGEDKFKSVELDHNVGDEIETRNTESQQPAKATVYEIWDKPSNKVIFLAKGAKEILEETEPYLNFKDFFPCPRPAYGTLETASLIPVPDYVFYQDQIEEIDDLTARIGALVDQLKVAGFYPASASDASEAIEQIAMKGVENVLIPIPNWNQFKEGGGASGMIEWWPVDNVIKVLEGCFTARKQLIDDVYQITGISDIMRGEGDKEETAAAQNIKSQWGSVRIRDRQAEMAQFARQSARLTAEIISEQFQPQTLMDMTNMKLPTQADLDKAALQSQIAAMQQRAAQAQQMQQAQPMPPQNPQLAGPPAGMQ